MGVIASYSNMRYDLPLLRRAQRAAARRRPAPVQRAQPRVHRLEQRLSVEEKQHLLDAYRSGETSRSIADRVGIARNSVDRLVRTAGIPLQVPRLTEEERLDAIRLYADGWSLQRIGDHLGRTQGTIWHLLKREGIELRTTHGLPKDGSSI